MKSDAPFLPYHIACETCGDAACMYDNGYFCGPICKENCLFIMHGGFADNGYLPVKCVLTPAEPIIPLIEIPAPVMA